jgi:hypothetical protein
MTRKKYEPSEANGSIEALHYRDMKQGSDALRDACIELANKMKRRKEGRPLAHERMVSK